MVSQPWFIFHDTTHHIFPTLAYTSPYFMGVPFMCDQVRRHSRANPATLINIADLEAKTLASRFLPTRAPVIIARTVFERIVMRHNSIRSAA
jgi:hypothetical protein